MMNLIRRQEESNFISIFKFQYKICSHSFHHGQLFSLGITGFIMIYKIEKQ